MSDTFLSQAGDETYRPQNDISEQPISQVVSGALLSLIEGDMSTTHHDCSDMEQVQHNSVIQDETAQENYNCVSVQPEMSGNKDVICANDPIAAEPNAFQRLLNDGYIDLTKEGFKNKLSQATEANTKLLKDIRLCLLEFLKLKEKFHYLENLILLHEKSYF